MVQSLILMPSVEDGQIVYHDSSHTKAAKYDQVLVSNCIIFSMTRLHHLSHILGQPHSANVEVL